MLSYLKKKITVSLPYYARRAKLFLMQLLWISPRGKYRFSRRYYARPCFTDERSKQAEDRKQVELARKAKKGIVEIGVLNGETSRILAEANQNIPVVGIDPLVIDSMSETLIGTDEAIRRNTAHLPNYRLIKDFSYNVVKGWAMPFDYIYIDGSHVYEDVKRDFEEWLPKLSKGGLMGFHDSTMYRGGMPYWPGPSRLADELIHDPRMEYVDSVGRVTIFRKR